MEPFKNLLGIKAAQKIAKAIEAQTKDFNRAKFLKNLEAELEPLELKQRVALIKRRLDETLPKDPEKSFSILMKTLKKNEKDSEGLESFLVWPLTHFVMENGLEHHALSMTALKAMTEVFTAEWAIRPFLIHQEKETLKTLEKWVKDPSEHVRRLVSEGSRPLLPWGQKIQTFVNDPEKTWHLLEILKNDSSEYVRKSVANHLNDHSKNHGDWLVKRLKEWSKVPSKEMNWIIRHSTRTLVKKGHSGALSLHGIKSFELKDLKIKILTPKVKLGGALQVEVRVSNPTSKKLPLMIDHDLLLLKSNGKHASKVFKGTKLTLEPNESKTLTLRVPLKPVTTRKYYSGKQGWGILVNGNRSKHLWFELLTGTSS